MRFLVPLALLLAACGTLDTAAAPAPADSPEPIRISMSLYVVDDIDSGAGSALASQRELPKIDTIAARMNKIWGQAGIQLTIETIARIGVPAEVLGDLGRGDTASFLAAATGGSFVVPGPATINGFYVRRIGTANGVAPAGSRIFFVADEPTVHDERVSSHEVGHILGLHHDLDDPGRLMFSGTNGTELTKEQVTAARYVAAGILDAVR